jgi:threonine synthase
MDAKALVDCSGVGCEPASAASVAGTRKLIEQGLIKPEETIVGILTGNLLKDPGATVDYHTGGWPKAQFANRPVQLEPTLDAVQSEIAKKLG